MVQGVDGDSYFASCLDIYVVKVNPETEKMDDDTAKNTLTYVWLEFGPWLVPSDLDEFERECLRSPEGTPAHDVDLDCEAANFETAICILAERVSKHYGSISRTRIT